MGSEISSREILELLLHSLHTETVRKRCVNVHRFECRDPPLILGLGVESAHIMKPVAKLYEYYADILLTLQEASYGYSPYELLPYPQC